MAHGLSGLGFAIWILIWLVVAPLIGLTLTFVREQAAAWASLAVYAAASATRDDENAIGPG